MGSDPRLGGKGPFRADQLRSGDPYELSAGHAIHCAPTGGRGSAANAAGILPLSTDPAVRSAGVDTGFAPEPDMLRAPDIAIGNVPEEPGWVKGVPPLAVEYADGAQDEAALATKIEDLLAHGTRFVWVVRLVGPRRVEVHEPGAPMTVALPGAELRAPGVLANPVAVEALYDPEVAMDAALRNLLQRRGYASLDAVRDEGVASGKAEGKAASILALLRLRGLVVPAEVEARVHATRDDAALDALFARALTVARADELLAT
ncbi:MAG: hypothetical protein HY908_27725 [Myxococcales bacterium]|nr:hypothetical protein [Myxococcales bacterium]